MKKSILTICLVLAGFWCVQAGDSPVATPGIPQERDDAKLTSGELLSDHVVEAEFEGTIHQECRFRTALCPNRCDHAKDFAVFRVINYLSYQKPGKYGDEKQERVEIDMNPAHKPILQGADILKKIGALRKGDKVRLHWSHFYRHQGIGSFPERPVISVEPMPPAEKATRG